MDSITYRVDSKINNDFIDTINKIDHKIHELGRNSSIDNNYKSKEIFNYILSSRYNITFGYSLRRYICMHYGTCKGKKTVNDDGKIVIKLKFNENIYEFIVNDYDLDDYDFLDNEEIKTYSKVFEKIAEHNGFKISRKSGDYNFNDISIKKYFSNEMIPKKDTFIKISFALHMNADETTEILINHLGLPGYNTRNVKDIICCFCQSNISEEYDYNKYTEVLRILEKYEKLKTSSEIKKFNDNFIWKGSIKADSLVNKFKNMFKGEKELLNYLLNNQEEFNNISQTAFEEYKKLYKLALELCERRIEIKTRFKYNVVPGVCFIKIFSEDNSIIYEFSSKNHLDDKKIALAKNYILNNINKEKENSFKSKTITLSSIKDILENVNNKSYLYNDYDKEIKANKVDRELEGEKELEVYYNDVLKSNLIDDILSYFVPKGRIIVNKRKKLFMNINNEILPVIVEISSLSKETKYVSLKKETRR